MLKQFYIFIIGCPAVGKSTLSMEICEKFPQFNYFTDLNALKEIFLINDIIDELIMNNKTSFEIEEALSNLYTKTIFWKDLIQKKKLEGFVGQIELDTKKTKDGGHDILTPFIWDEILIRSINKYKSNNSFHIVEFSRGIDLKYMEEFKLNENEIYPHCFYIVKRENPEICESNSVIIHLHADLLERQKRNKMRRENGEHFVAEEVMRKVYVRDIFSFQPVINKHIVGILSDDIPIPVISINNTSENIIENFYPAISYLKQRLGEN